MLTLCSPIPGQPDVYVNEATGKVFKLTKLYSLRVRISAGQHLGPKDKEPWILKAVVPVRTTAQSLSLVGSDGTVLFRSDYEAFHESARLTLRWSELLCAADRLIARLALSTEAGSLAEIELVVRSLPPALPSTVIALPTVYFITYPDTISLATDPGTAAASLDLHIECSGS